VLAALATRGSEGGSCEDVAAAAGTADEVETVYLILERLAANPGRGVAKRAGLTPLTAQYVKA
jgi:glucose-6-phosphate isomerase